ncbi:MAG TPA: PEPxxWA-CTERM sorting domain-containing protein [Phenylobacterium sp.]|uniref:PEPxxWA-CTERM sorting domain-containing protein n=1 Tax=Phenylobacterium sp. TaxID=1871053 RepID=UPI002D613608|nr:PEPxxWA-CTERM sorting domain-containing protein [Phenylobacterium sp.]HZZ68680.1 PEPxxWA-CTERM sorting domain-containing protein [Phenylobacterium sp.]
MRSLVFVVALGGLLTTTSAQAAVTLGFTGTSDSSISLLSQTWNYPGDGLNSAAMPLKPNKQNSPTVNYGGSTQADVAISKNDKKASFTSGVAARGPALSGETSNGASATSTTGVNAIITNSGGAPVTLNSIGSTIIQAGMGFMIQNPTGTAINNNVFTGYGANTAGQFIDFNKNGAMDGETIATSSFSFNVYGADDSTVLYTLSGSVSLGFDDEGNVVESSDVADAANVLNDFTSVLGTKANGNPLPLNKNYLAGYEWDETNIDVLLDQILDAGASTQLFYSATSTVDITAPCVSTTECLVAYSGFGDPVGRGGGVQSALFALNADANSNPCPDDDSQICFSPQKIKPFSKLEVTGVPEPATWASLVLGFGLLGGALRRRGAPSYS